MNFTKTYCIHVSSILTYFSICHRLSYGASSCARKWNFFFSKGYTVRTHLGWWCVLQLNHSIYIQWECWKVACFYELNLKPWHFPIASHYLVIFLGVWWCTSMFQQVFFNSICIQLCPISFLSLLNFVFLILYWNFH